MKKRVRFCPALLKTSLTIIDAPLKIRYKNDILVASGRNSYNLSSLNIYINFQLILASEGHDFNIII